MIGDLRSKNLPLVRRKSPGLTQPKIRAHARYYPSARALPFPCGCASACGRGDRSKLPTVSPRGTHPSDAPPLGTWPLCLGSDVHSTLAALKLLHTPSAFEPMRIGTHHMMSSLKLLLSLSLPALGLSATRREHSYQMPSRSHTASMISFFLAR